jgi:hypothetical protein
MSAVSERTVDREDIWDHVVSVRAKPGKKPEKARDRR